MTSLPSAEHFEVILKIIERFGIVSTALLGVIAWLLIRYTRKSTTETSSDPKGWQTKVEAELNTLRHVIESLEHGWRTRFDQQHEKIIVMEARLAPLFTVFDRRLAEMLHQPHEHAATTDALIDKYRENPDRLSDQELNHLISLIYERYEVLKRSQAPEDQASLLAATLFLAILDGIRNARAVLRTSAAQRDAEAKRQAALIHALQQPRSVLECPRAMSWWQRLKQWLLSPF